MVIDRVPVSFALPAVDVEMSAAEGEGENKLRRFSGTAYTGVKARVGGWAYPVVVDLSGMTVTSKSRPILRDHDVSRVVGHTEKVEVTPRMVRVEGVISGANAHAAEVIASSENKFPWQMSIGPVVDKVVFVEDGETVSVNGRKLTGPLYVIRQSRLSEISFVALGADDNTSASVAASAAGDSTIGVLTMKFADYLKDLGVEDNAALGEKALAKLKLQWELEHGEKPEKKESSVKTAGKLRLEAEAAAASRKEENDNRISEVAANFIKDNPSNVTAILKLAEDAMERSDSPEKFELELHRANFPKTGGKSGRRVAAGVTNRVIEAALCVAGGLKDVEKKFTDQELQLAHDEFKTGIGLKQIMLMAAKDNGYNSSSLDVNLEVQRYAFGMSGQHHAHFNAFSTISLPGILSNSANKFVFEGWNAVDSAWRMITAIRPVRDFKEITSYSLTGDLEYTQVGPGGELKHGTLGETTYTNKADSYGKMLAITRQDIINDDLSALSTVPRRLGRGAALKVNDVFWTQFLNNSSFFHTDNSNVSTGNGSALGAADGAAINAAEVIFMKQTDPDGKPLGIMPRVMLVPPTLKNTAARWMGGQLIVTGASSTTLPNVNVYQGRYTVVSSPYMENTSYTGNSNAAWYLLADPGDMAVIETCFLNGKEQPTVESADADFNVLGIQMRGYHDFGVRKQEPRAGVRSAGS